MLNWFTAALNSPKGAGAGAGAGALAREAGALAREAGAGALAREAGAGALAREAGAGALAREAGAGAGTAGSGITSLAHTGFIALKNAAYEASISTKKRVFKEEFAEDNHSFKC